MFTLHCKPLYTPTDIDPTPRLSTLARLRRHAHQTCLIIKSIPWGKSDRAGLQVADYCCWAVFRKWQRQDMEHYDRIKGALCSEFDIFQRGARHYY